MVQRIFKKKTTSKINHKNTLETIEESVLDSGKDVDVIREEVIDAGKDVDEIKEDVDEIIKKQDSILKKFKSRLKPDKFAFDDVAQQIVGAIIVSSPLAVTEEVWRLAGALDITRLILMVGITITFDILLIYYTKYQRVEKEKVLKFFPVRLISLLVISYIAATIILVLFGVIFGQVNSVFWAIKLILFVGLFANIGAGAADILK